MNKTTTKKTSTTKSIASEQFSHPEPVLDPSFGTHAHLKHGARVSVPLDLIGTMSATLASVSKRRLPISRLPELAVSLNVTPAHLVAMLGDAYITNKLNVSSILHLFAIYARNSTSAQLKTGTVIGVNGLGDLLSEEIHPLVLTLNADNAARHGGITGIIYPKESKLAQLIVNYSETVIAALTRELGTDEAYARINTAHNIATMIRMRGAK